MKKGKEVPEVTPGQSVLQAQWEKGGLLAIVVSRALMVYLDPRGLKERGVLWALLDLKEVKGTQDGQANLGCRVLGV